MTLKSITISVILTVILLVGLYALFLTVVSWPISSFSIDRAGLFGDSFGVLNSLFSGLAFAGIIITILLQKEELKLQRLELARSSSAQELSARLTALSELLSNYKSGIAVNADTLNKMHGSITNDEKIRINLEIKDLASKRDAVLAELELLVNKSKST